MKLQQNRIPAPRRLSFLETAHVIQKKKKKIESPLGRFRPECHRRNPLPKCETRRVGPRQPACRPHCMFLPAASFFLHRHRQVGTRTSTVYYVPVKIGAGAGVLVWDLLAPVLRRADVPRLWALSGRTGDRDPKGKLRRVTSRSGVSISGEWDRWGPSGPSSPSEAPRRPVVPGAGSVGSDGAGSIVLLQAGCLRAVATGLRVPGVRDETLGLGWL